MSEEQTGARVVSASREIAAGAEAVFELIADPARQPRWDGNDNLVEALDGRRIREIGQVFAMTTTKGNVRENHVVELEEGRRVAWKPAEPGGEPLGHLWRWELEPLGPSLTRVTHTYDWRELTDEQRYARARATTSDRLAASLERLAALAEGGTATSSRAVTPETLGAWLFRSSPGPHPLAELGGGSAAVTRCVRRSYRTDLIEPGQPVLLWISGHDRRHPPGLHAQGRTQGRATPDEDGQLVVPVAFELLETPIPRDELRSHPVLSRLEVIRMPAGSNPSYLTVTQLAELRHGWPQVTVR